MKYSQAIVASAMLNAVLLCSFVSLLPSERMTLQSAAVRSGSMTGFMPRMMQRGSAARASMAVGASPMKVLIVQNKGGGHGEIGYHLANRLADKGHKVTLLGDPATKKEAVPFSEYPALEAKGVTVAYGDACDPSTFTALGEFDAVFDNIAKSKDTCKTVADLAKGWGVKNFGYVSSAGMYKPGAVFPMSESLPVKDTAGQKEVEDYLAEIGLPWSSFRPQYIYGPLTNKRDYLDYFFDRVVRGQPVPVAGSGQQLVTLTHANDVAGMLESVLDAPDKAAGQVFNCATDQLISVDALIEACAKIAGVATPPIVHYDPKAVTLEKKAFPFRDSHFFVAPDKAKTELGYQCEHDLETELKAYYEGYKAIGKDKKDMSFPIDEAIFSQVSPLPA
eukprot:CAMPEP_0197518038 /NCGR_PEP_ID=MMETSP1318-20131121/3150_1 /TAXON_ID=552666 /ORGANISM="Partenskyella glossopodia, Strain RCC365" /LENGTH=390 /DNA_ID=CAMNT_0043068077 /DNA_START=51 /DNA_END=1223 /DNA_ORIENTATION=-